jgi:hypothetical protein
VACLVLLPDAFARRSWRRAGVAGVCFGLVLLTKPEVAIALGAAVIAGWWATYTLAGEDRRALATSAAAFAGMAVVPSAVFLGYFVARMDIVSALRATAGAWVPLFGTGITNNAFYRWSIGVNAPVENAGLMLMTFAGFLALIGAAIGVSWANSDTVRHRTRLLRIGDFDRASRLDDPACAGILEISGCSSNFQPAGAMDRRCCDRTVSRHGAWLVQHQNTGYRVGRRSLLRVDRSVAGASRSRGLAYAGSGDLSRRDARGAA